MPLTSVKLVQLLFSLFPPSSKLVCFYGRISPFLIIHDVLLMFFNLLLSGRLPFSVVGGLLD